MNSTKFAQWFYWISIVVLVATALGIVWRLIILPPDLKGLDVVGLAGSVLAVAATVLAILGAVAVAAWWTSLDNRVTNQVTTLYNKQKEEVMKPLERDLEQSKTRIEGIKASLDDFEKTITESFAALGPLLAEPIAQKAMAANRYPTFPFYMTKSYLDLIKREDKLQALEREIASYREGLDIMQSRKDPKDKDNVKNYLEAFNLPNLSITLILGEWRRTSYWWQTAKNNQSKTPLLKPEEFDNVQKDFDSYRARMEKAEQDFDRLKSDAQSLFSSYQ